MPYTGERIALLRVPLVGKDGTFYGLCGFEISQSWFKFAHPQPSTLNHLTCLLVQTPIQSSQMKALVREAKTDSIICQMEIFPLSLLATTY